MMTNSKVRADFASKYDLNRRRFWALCGIATDQKTFWLAVNGFQALSLSLSAGSRSYHLFQKGFIDFVTS